MPIKTVAVISPGDMGHSVGRVLREHGLDIVACLDGRSERTWGLAREAGIRNLPNLDDLVATSDLILSIVDPGQAVNVAKQVAGSLRATGTATPLADCNATSPGKAREIEAIVTSAGGLFIDASIIGGPPGGRQPPRFYASGPHAEILAQLDGMGIQVRRIGETIGSASGLKMCYAAMTKGTQALQLALLAVAEVMGLTEELRQELTSSQPQVYARMEAQLPRLPANAGRWISEMEEIAATFKQAGVTPDFHRGAADIIRALAETPFAKEAPESVDMNRTLEETITALVQCLPAGSRHPDSGPVR